MVASAAQLLREHGASATSIDRVLAHSGASRGSVYHYFPQGRAQLIGEAVELAGDYITALIDAMAADGDPLRALDAFFDMWRTQLAGSGYRAGCPIVAVAVEANDDAPQLARSAAAVFTRWTDALADMLERGGVPHERGKCLATVIVAAVEGAVIMCRAEQSTAPLDATAAEIRDLLTRALPGRPGNDRPS